MRNLRGKRLIFFVSMSVVWELISINTNIVYFPRITLIYKKIIELLLAPGYWENIIASLEIVILGFAIATFMGITIGIAVGSFPKIEHIIMPAIDFMRNIPSLALLPLAIMILGIGLKSKLLIVMWTAWPSILLNTIQAVKTTNVSLVEASKVMGANDLQTLFKIRIPLAIPDIFVGMRAGISNGFISIIAAEMLGSSKGLGYIILMYSQTFRFLEMYASIFIVGLIGLSVNVIFNNAQIGINKKLKF